jgi:hypothetical protein
VLCFEWVMLALAIPVAVNVAGVSAATAWVVFGAASALTLAAIALMGRPAGRWLGWGVQALALAAGVVVPLLAIAGALFAALYFAALRLGATVDRVKGERSRQAGATAAPGPGTMAEPDRG